MDFSKNTVKVIKLRRANWSSLTFALLVHFKCTSFPQAMVKRGECTIIWTRSVRKMPMIIFLCFPAVAICCTICQVNVSEFGPGDALLVDVNLTTVHTLVRFCVYPLKQITLPACHKRYEKELTCAMHTRQSLLCHHRLWPHTWTSALNWYKLQLSVRILQRFCLIYSLSQAKFDNL
jgi:hypothetical protein